MIVTNTSQRASPGLLRIGNRHVLQKVGHTCRTPRVENQLLNHWTILLVGVLIPSVQSLRPGEAGTYLHHEMPAGAQVVPKNTAGVHEGNAWAFHYQVWRHHLDNGDF